MIRVALLIGLAAQDATPPTPAPPVQAPAVPAAPLKAAAAPAPAADDPSAAWQAFRAKVAERLTADRARLKEIIDKTYLTDLGLDYDDRDNRDYLTPKLRQIAQLDPDVGGPLVEMLEAAGGGPARHRAENAVRVLELIDLEPYVPRLQELLAAGKLEVRLRALHLLARVRAPGLTPLLVQLLAETPEVLLPRVLASAGRNGDPALVPHLLPFLERPSVAQRLGALGALADLGALEAMTPGLKAVRDIGTEAAFVVLLGLLQGVAPRVGDAERDAFVTACLGVVERPELTREDVLDGLALLSALPAERLAPFLPKAAPVLTRLLDHGNPDVQFKAAMILETSGDKSGTKYVLERLNNFVKKNKRLPYAYYQRARALLAFGKTADALRDVKQAIQFSTANDPQLHFLAAQIEIERASPAEVLKNLKNAEATPPELRRFRAENPAIEPLIDKHKPLKKLFEEQ